MKDCSDLTYIYSRLNRSQLICDAYGPNLTVRHACDLQINLTIYTFKQF